MSKLIAAALCVLCFTVSAYSAPITVAQPSSQGCVAMQLITAYGGTIDTVAARDNLVFLGEGFGLSILNTDVPSQPVRLAYLPLGGVLSATPQLVGERLYAVVLTQFEPPAYSLVAVDINNPAAPALLSALPFPSDPIVHGPAVANDLAFLPFRAGAPDDGLQIVDLSTPGRPALRGRFPVPNVNVVAAIDNIVALGLNDALLLVDVTNPDAPRLRERIPTPGPIRDLWAEGSRIYAKVATLLNPATAPALGGIPDTDYRVEALVFELTSQRQSRLLGSVLLAESIASPADVAFVVNQQRIFTALSGRPPSLWSVIDVADPARPAGLGVVAKSLGYRLFVEGARMYTLEDQLKIVDIASLAAPKVLAAYPFYSLYQIDPSSPRRVTGIQLPAPPADASAATTGVAGNRVYRLIDRDGVGDSLEVFDATNPASPQLAGQVAVTDAMRILPTVGERAFVQVGRDGDIALVDAGVSPPALRGVITAPPGHRFPTAVATAGSRIFVRYFEGVVFFDVSATGGPSVLGTFPLPPDFNSALAVAGSTLLHEAANVGPASAGRGSDRQRDRVQPRPARVGNPRRS